MGGGSASVRKRTNAADRQCAHRRYPRAVMHCVRERSKKAGVTRTARGYTPDQRAVTRGVR